MTVKATGVAMLGICDVQTEYCTAKETPSAITAVFSEPAVRQINVCTACLKEQMRTGEWEVRGAKLYPDQLRPVVIGVR